MKKVLSFWTKLKREKVISVFNAATGEYGDMLDMGIIDPAKVTRTALQAAGSVAGLMITTEAMVSELPADAPAMPGGGMPDMGRNGRHDVKIAVWEFSAPPYFVSPNFSMLM